MKHKMNLGEGNVGKLMIKLSIPAIIAQIVNLLYNMVDRIYIGHIPETGDLALTGLGLCFPIIMLVTAFANLIGGGGAPRAAIHMGRKEFDEAERILGSGIASLILISIIITVGIELTGESILRLFGASENTLPYALDYMQIYVLGTICVLLSLGLNTFITTQGFSNIAMKTVLIGAVSNIILDPIFIFALKLGVKGAALATIISQGLSAIWVLRFLASDRSILKIRKEYIKIDTKVLGPVLALGVSPFIMSATESAINICFNHSLAKYGGDVAVGALTIITSLMQLCILPVQGLSQGAQPIMSYNYGAERNDRVLNTFKTLLICSLVYTLFFVGIVEVFPTFFIRIFNDSSALLETTTWAVRVYMIGMSVFGIQMAVQQTFVALGQAKLSLFIACLRKLILLIPLIYVLPKFWENKVFAVFLAEPVADIISVTTAATLFALNRKKIFKT